MSIVADPVRFRRRQVAVRADKLAQWSTIALGFSIPISTAVDNVLAGVIVLCWLAAGDYREKLLAIRDNPIALIALALFGLLLLGTAHGAATPAERFAFLAKYKDLLYIALLVFVFRESTVRRYALFGFAAAMLLTLLLSCAIGFGILPETFFSSTAPGNPMVFKLHITQNVLMAYAAFLLASAARLEEFARWRLWLMLASLLAVYNVLFMVQGRTGHIVIGVLMIFFFANWLRWKGFAAGILAIAVLAVAAFHESASFHDRVLKAGAQYRSWRGGETVADDNSIGLRMQWYKAGAAIVSEHPLIGVGTGGFVRAYAGITGKESRTARHPHNEYLLLAIQVGILGAGLLIYLFYRQWRLAAELPAAFERDLARGLVLTMAIGCLLNSFLVDHAEGLFFAWMSALLFAGLGTQTGRPA